MNAQKKEKRRRGDRRDGKLVKVPAMQAMMGYLYPHRADCEVYMNDDLDVTNLMSFLEKKNAEHPEYRTTLFHCLVVAIARILRERPKLNRFVAGWRMYERNEISISFVVKRRFRDDAEESLMVLVPTDEDTLDSVSRKIVGDVKETRKSETATGGIDEMLERFMKLPHPVFALAIRIIRWLDFWGINPRFLTDGDPNYTSVLLSNLGSIRAGSVYHHLNNYGTNSLLITIGTIRDEERLMKDGTKQVRKMLDVGITLDERIGDGFYFAKSLRLLHHVFEEPELLEQPIGVPSGFDYES